MQKKRLQKKREPTRLLDFYDDFFEFVT